MARKYPIEQHFGSTDRGLTRVKANAGFAGRSTIPTGSLSLVVAASQVESDSIILLGTSSTASGGFGSTVVRSINPGVGFVVGFSSNTVAAGPVDVMWRIYGQ